MKYYVYRSWSNSANQAMEFGPVRIATVEADSDEDARMLAGKKVTILNGQYISARLASEVDAEEEGRGRVASP